jgi:hypothetical protein
MASIVEGSYADFEALWIESLDTWAKTNLDKLPVYGEGDSYTDPTTGTTRELTAADTSILGTKKTNINDWDDSDY